MPCQASKDWQTTMLAGRGMAALSSCCFVIQLGGAQGVDAGDDGVWFVNCCLEAVHACVSQCVCSRAMSQGSQTCSASYTIYS